MKKKCKGDIKRERERKKERRKEKSKKERKKEEKKESEKIEREREFRRIESLYIYNRLLIKSVHKYIKHSSYNASI